MIRVISRRMLLAAISLLATNTQPMSNTQEKSRSNSEPTPYSKAIAIQKTSHSPNFFTSPEPVSMSVVMAKVLEKCKPQPARNQDDEVNSQKARGLYKKSVNPDESDEFYGFGAPENI